MKITKKEAALKIHEYILSKGEEDERDFSPALFLYDLYDCGKCVWHISQVYVKGIILPDSQRVFGTETKLSEEEYTEILERADHREKRIIPSFNRENNKIHYIGSEYLEMLRSGRKPEEIKDKDINCIFEPGVMLKDVRTISLKELNQNPCMLTSDLFQPLVLYCEKGYQSSLAANILLKYGFKKVYVVKD